MKIIIDRFEGNIAVVELENKAFTSMPKILVPQGAKEGDVILINVDEEETELRRQRIQKMINGIIDPT